MRVRSPKQPIRAQEGNCVGSGTQGSRFQKPGVGASLRDQTEAR